MAIRAAGTYVSKSKGAKKGKSRGKENRFNKNKFFNLTSRLFPVTNHGETSHPKMRSRQDLTPLLIGRTFSVNQGDLECADPLQAINSQRNFDFKVNKVRGHDCLSVFNGMEVAREKVAGMIRKWHTLIEADVEIATKDQSTWRFFVNAVTKRGVSKSQKNYAKTSEVKEIRKIIVEIVKEQAEGLEVEKMVKLLSTDAISREIESRCSHIYPITALLRKVKPIKNMQCIVKPKQSSDLGEEESLENEFHESDEE
ncbi:unnamed protein product [Medioppia subpectinata]|uniref:40S ribosomal protein S3a n=1 Tax=Medioppia subpectinata TaxID=1979941 RepID=A0A7R9KPW1_9ACAR|nr:unnamed protein product [Medioppia subpectinata]CAG2107309.1 unnamed protein product [Medioppia subpectinata]